MNILFLTRKDTKHPRSGGAEVVIKNYASRLVKAGHNVTWVSSGFEGGKEQEIIDGIKIVRIFSLHTIYFKAYGWYKKYKKENQIDLIIDEAGGIPLLSPLYEKKIPIIFFIHHIGDQEWSNEWKGKMGKIIGSIFKKTFDQILKLYKNKTTITVSQSTKNELVKRYKFDENKVIVIPNAVDLKPIEEINFGAKKNQLLFLGRQTPIKRVEDSIRAFYEFQKINNNYKLKIVGDYVDEDYKQKIQNLIKELELENKILIESFSKQARKDALLESKLILVTSKKEGFGLIVYEANCFGLPAIGYKVPGLQDSIVEGKNGFLAKDNDIIGLAKNIEKCLENYEQNAKSSLEFIKSQNTWDDNAKILEKIILETKK